MAKKEMAVVEEVANRIEKSLEDAVEKAVARALEAAINSPTIRLRRTDVMNHESPQERPQKRLEKAHKVKPSTEASPAPKNGEKAEVPKMPSGEMTVAEAAKFVDRDLVWVYNAMRKMDPADFHVANRTDRKRGRQAVRKFTLSGMIKLYNLSLSSPRRGS
jgi:hypothetical protein